MSRASARVAAATSLDTPATAAPTEAGFESAAVLKASQPLRLAENGVLRPQTTASNVFTLVQFVRAKLREKVDSTMTWETLRSPTMDINLIRPLVATLTKMKHPALIYALLINRLRFQAEADLELAFSGLYATRAMACELLAIRSLSVFATDAAELIEILTASFCPFEGATALCFVEDDRPTADELKKMHDWSRNEAQNALELAIQSEARKFIAAPLTQRVLQGIYDGDLTMDAPGGHSLLADDYKRRPVQAYHIREGHLLNHYLLRTPRVRAGLELATFAVMAVLYVAALKFCNLDHMNGWEVAFIFFTLGFCLDEMVQATNGLYFADLYNSLDAAFMILFFAFMVARIYGLAVGSRDAVAFSFDLLSAGAIILFPRFAGVLLSDSIVILGIQCMFADFTKFMGLAAICASGFAFSLTHMANGHRSLGYIAYLLLKIWFGGNTYLGFQEADQFGVLGPTVMVLFAAFANILLLTVLIAILSADFAAVQATATEAFLFQKAIKTLERVKSEALHEFLPPFNIVAFAILLPASHFMTPRYLHKTNVMLSRTFNAPVLLTISLWMRYRRQMLGGRLHVDEGWSSILSLKSRKDDLAIRPFERGVSDIGRRVEGLDDSGSEELSNKPRTAPSSNPAGALSSATSSLSGSIRRVMHAYRNESLPRVSEQDLHERLTVLEDGQKELLATLRALVGEHSRSQAESVGATEGAE